MFGRTKIRQILVKHQEEIQTDSKAHFKSASGRNTNNNNKGDNQENNAKWNDLNNAGNGMRSTPTLDTTQLFSFNERNLKPLLKTRNAPQIEELDYKNMDIFHRAVCPILILGQCFALMPVLGVHRPDPRHLRFSFKSLPMMLTLIYLSANSVLTISTVKYLLQIGINAKNFVAIVFFGCVQCACVLFLSLAPRWPRLMRYWIQTELTFTRKPYVRPKRNLAKRIRLAAAVIIFLSMCEHGLYLCSAVYSYTRRTHLCSPLLNSTSSLSFSGYIRLNYKYAFTLLPHHSASGVFVMVTNAVSTFIWNFMDLFIMMISIGVAYRFEQITMRVKKLADKEIPETVFTEIREHYVKVCELLEYIDDNLAGIILLSCMNNLYFVCYQLLNVFNKLRWPINYLYFWYSLLYLIGRTAFVFLTAASINDESKGSIGVLRRLPNKMWCTEVERLIFLMTTQTVALSGKKFYFLTRRLLFGMAGTIVTYELVLLQFDEPYRSKGLPELCE